MPTIPNQLAHTGSHEIYLRVHGRRKTQGEHSCHSLGDAVTSRCLDPCPPSTSIATTSHATDLLHANDLQSTGSHRESSNILSGAGRRKTQGEHSCHSRGNAVYSLTQPKPISSTTKRQSPRHITLAHHRLLLVTDRWADRKTGAGREIWLPAGNEAKTGGGKQTGYHPYPRTNQRTCSPLSGVSMQTDRWWRSSVMSSTVAAPPPLPSPTVDRAGYALTGAEEMGVEIVGPLAAWPPVQTGGTFKTPTPLPSVTNDTCRTHAQTHSVQGNSHRTSPLEQMGE